MPENTAQPDFDAPALARSLLATATHGALATHGPGGTPHVTLVALAQDADDAPVIITSHLSGHTGHMERDPRVSLLVADIGKGDPLAHPRLTLSGRAVAVHPGEPAYDRIRPLYLLRNPKAQIYVDLPGFWFWRIEPATLALNGGFGRAWTGIWADAVRTGA
ncbi:MAG: HugZ family protein [Beijerinckiaceae bacterium]